MPMTTAVGLQSSFDDAVRDLVELDYDAIEAYVTAINRLDNEEYRSKLSEFKADHDRHIQELGALLLKHDVDGPTGPSLIKQWLTKGKVVLAELSGDNAILAAMLHNEEDTNTAYQRVSEHNEIWSDAVDIIQRGLQDERRHKAWLEETLAKIESV
jgi:rubrerythrin